MTETKEIMAIEESGAAAEGTPLDPLAVKELKEKIVDAISTIYDPEIPVNIYELGLIYEVQVLPMGNIWVQMTLTSPACPVAGSLPGEVEDMVRSVDGVKEAEIDLTFDPPWDQEMMSEEAKLELGFM